MAATNFNLTQNIGVFIASIVVFVAIIVLLWVPWGNTQDKPSVHIHTYQKVRINLFTTNSHIFALSTVHGFVHAK